jgi:methionine biosynthesis protein MetW
MNTTFFQKFKEYLINNFIGTRHEWKSHIDNVFRVFDNHLKEYYPNNIIDIGCGDGSRTILIAKYFDLDMSKVYGVDYDENLISECKTLFNVSKMDLEVDTIPHSDEFFDIVICNQVLEHLKNYKQVIYELIRITKRGGYIVIGIPNLSHLINRIYLLFGIQPMCIHLDGPHIRAFTHRNFVKMLSSMPSIKLKDTEGALMYPLPFFLAKYLVRYFVGPSGYVCYLLQKE